MTFRCEDNREAFLAALAAVLAVDHVGSNAERDYLFEHVRTMHLFDDLDRDAFKALFAAVTAKLVAALPHDAHGALTPTGLDALFKEVRRALEPWLRSALVQVATGLGASDSITPDEAALIQLLRRKLA